MSLRSGSIVLSFLFIPFTSWAGILYVSGDVSSSGNGSSWNTAYKTIQEAIDAAPVGTDIWVAQGQYHRTGESIAMKSGVNLIGGFEGDSGTEGDISVRDPARFISELNGGGEDRLVDGAPDTTIDGFLIRNGAATNGGGIYFDASLKVGGAMRVDNCHFVNCEGSNVSGAGGGAIIVAGGGIIEVANSSFLSCRAYRGGAIYLLESSADIESCIFSSNNAIRTVGGAIALFEFNTSQSYLRCSKTSFIGNSAGPIGIGGGGGGAVSIYGGSQHEFSLCTFSNNFATNVGGAIYMEDGVDGEGKPPFAISQCTFGNNTAGQAGGLYLLNAGAWNISKSTFTGNRALITLSENTGSINGGGMCIDGVDSSVIAISECNFFDNLCDSWGGGVAILDGDVTLTKSRFERNYCAGPGGALYVRDTASASISKSYFLSNASPSTGSAIHFDGVIDTPGSPLEVVNCLIAKNSGGTGTIRCGFASSSLDLRHCTVADNRASQGSALSADPGSFINAVNCNIWGNRGISVIDADSPGGIGVSHSNCPEAASLGNGNMEADPIFVDPAANNYSVADNSPVINAAVVLAEPVTEDIRGLPRPEGPNPDMGAYEGGSIVDTDGDGLGDAIEGTEDTDDDGMADNADPDSDNDGLGDGVERDLDPDDDDIPNFRDTDSDNDGHSDQDEAAAGSNPYNAASFPGSDVRGSVQVNISPSYAIELGAVWSIDEEPAMYASGAVVSNLPVGEHIIYCKELPSWRSPSTIPVTVEANQTKAVEAIYEPDWGRFLILKPNGGESFNTLGKMPIRWRELGSLTGESVSIDLLEDGRRVMGIKNDTPNDGEFNWQIPGDRSLNGRRFTIRIKSTRNSQVKDTSDGVFSITPSP
ncbi:MAG: DUF1565 domain-containing protein [Candidatus Hydrogenedentes bacterium]|nr:DUF1565 domain-containing protein [Candidatus Hydrogenedentota bacterium]